jgi:hypothetical protein
LQEYEFPHDAGGDRRNGLRAVQLFYRMRAIAMDRLQSRSIHRECGWTLRNIGTKRRNQKFVFALGDGFADMAAIPTVGFDGMSLL